MEKISEQYIEQYKTLGYDNVREIETPEGTAYLMYNYYKNAGRDVGAVYIPPSLSDVDALVGFHPGMRGGSQGNEYSLWGTECYKEYIDDIIVTGNAPKNTIIVFADNMKDTKTVLNVTELAIEQGIELKNVGVIDFSYSGQTGMQVGGNIAYAYPDLEVRIANIDSHMLDGYYNDVVSHNKGKFNKGVAGNIDNKVLVMSLVPDKATYEVEENIKAAALNIAKNGHLSYLLTNSLNNHAAVRDEFLYKMKGVEFLVGKSDLICDPKNTSYIKVEKYNLEQGEWVESDINAEKKNGYIDTFLEKKYEFDLKKIEKYLGRKDENSLVFIDYYNAISGLQGIMNYISNNTDKNIFQLNSLEGNNIINGMFSYSEPFLQTTHLLDYRVKQGLLSCAVQVNDLAQTDATLAALAQSLGEDGLSGIIGKRILEKFASVLEGSVDSTARVTSYIGTVEPGSLGLFDSTQIDLLLNSKMMRDLHHQMKVSGSIYDKLVELKNSGSYGGDSFIEFNKLVDSYCVCMHKRHQSAAKLYYVYKSCLKRMQNFMDTKGITRVDDTHYQEFKDEIAKNKATIAELSEKAQQKETRTVYKAISFLGKTIYVPAGSEEYYPYKAECEAKIADLEALNRIMQETVDIIEDWNKLVNECNKEIYDAECDVNINFNQIVKTFPEIKPVFLDDTFA